MLEREGVAAEIFRVLRHQHAALRVLGQALDAAGEVDGVADRGVLQAALLRAHQADHGRPGVQTDAHVEVGLLRAELALERLQRVGHVQRAGDGAPGVVGLVERCTPHRHDAVADELVERAAMVEDHVDLQREIAVEERDDLLRRMADQAQEDQRVRNLEDWCATVSANIDTLTYDERRMAIDALGVQVRAYRKGSLDETGNPYPRWEMTMRPSLSTESVAYSTARSN